jgi:uncharacterized protein YdbL (DUF1318 family)
MAIPENGMKRWLPMSLVAGLVGLAACVTINVYFPAAAAEKAADLIIDDVWGTSSPPAAKPAAPAPGSGGAGAFHAALDFLIEPANAQDPNIDVSSPEITRIKAQMESRFAELKPQLDAGAIGLTADGYVAPRDGAQVALAARNALRSLIGNENADRAALYREIAVANGHAEWQEQIRKVFAQRWIAKAAAGWWYQDANGAWKQK